MRGAQIQKKKQKKESQQNLFDVLFANPYQNKEFQGYSFQSNKNSLFEILCEVFAWETNQEQFQFKQDKSCILDRDYQINFCRAKDQSKILNEDQTLKNKDNPNASVQITNYTNSLNSKKSKKTVKKQILVQSIPPQDFIGMLLFDKLSKFSKQKLANKSLQKIQQINIVPPPKQQIQQHKSIRKNIKSKNKVCFDEQHDEIITSNRKSKSIHPSSIENPKNSVQSGQKMLNAQQHSLIEESFILDKSKQLELNDKQKQTHFKQVMVNLSRISMNQNSIDQFPSPNQRILEMLNYSTINSKIDKAKKNRSTAQKNKNGKQSNYKNEKQINYNALNNKQMLNNLNVQSEYYKQITQRSQQCSNIQNAMNRKQKGIGFIQNSNQFEFVEDLKNQLQPFENNFSIKINGKKFNDLNQLQNKIKQKSHPQYLTSLVNQLQNKITIELRPTHNQKKQHQILSKQKQKKSPNYIEPQTLKESKGQKRKISEQLTPSFEISENKILYQDVSRSQKQCKFSKRVNKKQNYDKMQDQFESFQPTFKKIEENIKPNSKVGSFSNKFEGIRNDIKQQKEEQFGNLLMSLSKNSKKNTNSIQKQEQIRISKKNQKVQVCDSENRKQQQRKDLQKTNNMIFSFNPKKGEKQGKMQVRNIISQCIYARKDNNQKESGKGSLISQNKKSNKNTKEIEIIEELIQLKNKMKILQNKVSKQNFQQQQITESKVSPIKIKMSSQLIANSKTTNKLSLKNQNSQRKIDLISKNKLVQPPVIARSVHKQELKQNERRNKINSNSSGKLFFSQNFGNGIKISPSQLIVEDQKQMDISRVLSNYRQSQYQQKKQIAFFDQQQISLEMSNFLAPIMMDNLNGINIEEINDYQNFEKLIPYYPTKQELPQFKKAQQNPFLVGKQVFQLFGVQQRQCVNLFIQKLDNTSLLFTLDHQTNVLWKRNDSIYFGGGVRNSKGLWIKSGEGIQILEKKYVFKGTYSHGKWNGFGIYQQFSENEKIFAGQFKNNKKSGKGKQIDRMGNTFSGNWKENKQEGYGVQILSSGQVYQGNFINGQKQGSGIQHLSNGDSYKGQFLKNKFQGKGIYTWKNGSKYEGQFSRGKKSGHGIWKSQSTQNAEVYEGEYLNDRKHGYGIYKWPNGCYYEGHFKDDRKNGIGRTRYPNGRISISQWRQDKLIKKQLNQTNKSQRNIPSKLKSKSKQFLLQKELKRQQSKQKNPNKYQKGTKMVNYSQKFYPSKKQQNYKSRSQVKNDSNSQFIYTNPQLSKKLEMYEKLKKGINENKMKSYKFLQYF